MPRHYDPNQARVPAGHAEGGQWTDDGYGEDARLRHAFLGPAAPFAAPVIAGGARFVTQKAIEAALIIFAALSARNSRERQAIVVFRAREFPADEPLQIDDVRSLTREEVERVCKGIKRAEEKTDEAVRWVQENRPTRSPQVFGTYVHDKLKTLINGLGKEPVNPNFRAEQSILKNIAENAEQKPAPDGTKSIRVDILENAGNETICVYDLKTGRRPLYFPRMLEIRNTVFEKFGRNKRIIVTEIRPRHLRGYPTSP